MAAPQVLTSGPWTGVNDTLDPFDDAPDKLVDAENLYFLDPSHGSENLYSLFPSQPGGVYARPGWVVGNGGNPLDATGNTPGASVYAPTLTTGTYTFYQAAGKIFRVQTSGFSAVDVTPSGLWNPGATFMFLMGDTLIVSATDRPYACTNLSSTPITATGINYTDASVALSRGSTDTKVAIAATPYITPTSGNTTLAANPTGVSLPTGTIPLNTWGVFRVSVNNTGTVTVTAGSANFTTGYASEALAIAAVPATPTNQWNLGYFTVQTGVGHTFVDGTDALAGGASGNVANATNYHAGAAPPWSVYGKPVVYAGALFVIANYLGATLSRQTILWSEPKQPTVGYEQSGYADFWNLIQGGTGQLYALGATNLALYYWRSNAIGVVVGTPGSNFSSTATHDSVAINVGTVSPNALAQFNDTFFFLDPQGRPWMFRSGTVPVPIWYQMRYQWTLNAAAAASKADIENYAVGAIDPELNKYVVAPWLTTPGSGVPPSGFYCFDAGSGTYEGRLQIGDGVHVKSMAYIANANGTPQLTFLGSLTNAGTNYSYTWYRALVTDNVWKDNGAVPTILAKSGRLGYSAGTTWNARQGTLVAMSNAAVNVTVETPYTSSTTEGSALAPGASQDGTFRIPVGMDVRSARGMQFTVSPTTAASQWGLEQIQVVATAQKARPEDL